MENIVDVITRLPTSRTAAPGPWDGSAPEPPAPSVLIVGPETIFRQGLTTMIAARHPRWIVRVIGAIADAHRDLDDVDRMVVLVDLDGPDSTDPPARRWTRHLIVGLTDPAGADIPLRHVHAGYRAIILRGATPALFCCAMETTLTGGFFLPASPTEPRPRSPAELSIRQR